VKKTKETKKPVPTFLHRMKDNSS